MAVPPDEALDEAEDPLPSFLRPQPTDGSRNTERLTAA